MSVPRPGWMEWTVVLVRYPGNTTVVVVILLRINAWDTEDERVTVGFNGKDAVRKQLKVDLSSVVIFG